MRLSAWIISGLPQAKPTRQPAIEWLFEKETNSIAMSLAPGTSRIARGLVAVEGDLRVGEVVQDHQVVGARELDDPLEEGQIDDMRRRVRRERHDQHLRLGPGAADGLLEVLDEVRLVVQRHLAQVTAGDDHRVLVDRVGGVLHEHDVARARSSSARSGRAPPSRRSRRRPPLFGSRSMS